MQTSFEKRTSILVQLAASLPHLAMHTTSATRPTPKEVLVIVRSHETKVTHGNSDKIGPSRGQLFPRARVVFCSAKKPRFWLEII